MSMERIPLEERVARLEGTTRLFSSLMRRSVERAAQAEAAELDARLAPVLPTGSAGLRTDSTRDPSLASPLMDRLRADAGLAYSAAGSTLAALSTANVLDDPTFDSLPPAGPLASSWADLSPYWQARYVLDSGIAPVSVSMTTQKTRIFHTSAQLRCAVAWGGAADVSQVTIQVRSRQPAWMEGSRAQPDIDWPYVVASGRLALDTDTGTGTIMASTSLIDPDTGDVEIASDELDLAALGEVAMEGRPFVAYEDPLAGLSALPAIQFDIIVTNGGGGVRSVVAVLAEPQVQYTDEASPPQYLSWEPVAYYFGTRWLRISAQNIADGTWEALNFGVGNSVEDYGLTTPGVSTSAFHTTDSPSKFFAPVRGLYAAEMQVHYTQIDPGDRQLRIRRYAADDSGATVIGEIAQRATTDVAWRGQCGAEVPMEAGEYVIFETRQTSGGALQVLGAADSAETFAGLRLKGWIE